MNKVLFILLTYNCNFDCLYCFNKTLASNDKAKNIKKYNLDINVFEKNLYKLKELGFSQIYLTGGEPLVYKDLFLLLEILNKNKLDISLITNGLLINSNILNELANHNIKRIFLSIDSFDENIIKKAGKKYFNIEDRIKLILNSNIKLNINLSISKINISSIEYDFLKLEKYADRLNVIINPICDGDNSLFNLNNNEEKIFFRFLKEYVKVFNNISNIKKIENILSLYYKKGLNNSCLIYKNLFVLDTNLLLKYCFYSDEIIGYLNKLNMNELKEKIKYDYCDCILKKECIGLQ